MRNNIKYINNPLKLFLEKSLAFVLILGLLPILILCYLLASTSTKSNGIFAQKRIGLMAKEFKCFKFKTMIDMNEDNLIKSDVAALHKKRITNAGSFLRKLKLDELPQLFNILFGQMSFVGPRPDVPGYADKLIKQDKMVLSINPGVTCFSTLEFRHEEKLLRQNFNPQAYNDNIIWPKKVKLNLLYLSSASLVCDIKIILATLKIIDCKFIKEYEALNKKEA
tara:strand:+ start:1053 stop:1721 length:669 start_codon:yes stop_codon:yes gene_type:complete